MLKTLSLIFIMILLGVKDTHVRIFSVSIAEKKLVISNIKDNKVSILDVKNYVIHREGGIKKYSIEDLFNMKLDRTNIDVIIRDKEIIIE
jgi:hypothetical protein